MKIAIFSDIHDNLTNLEKCFNWCKKNSIEEMICCGDVTNSETLKYIADNFPGSIYLVKGNLELYDESEAEAYEKIKYFGDYGITEINGKTVGFCHEPFFIERILKEKKCDIIFYGHTHKPWQENRNGAMSLNPGTLGGVFYKATFAVWDGKEFELKILELL